MAELDSDKHGAAHIQMTQQHNKIEYLAVDATSEDLKSARRLITSDQSRSLRIMSSHEIWYSKGQDLILQLVMELSENRKVKGYEKVGDSINVYHQDPSIPHSDFKPVKIAAASIDAGGKYAATLSFTTSHGHLDLWKLSDNNQGCRNKAEGTGKFLITRDADGMPPKLDIALAIDTFQIVQLNRTCDNANYFVASDGYEVAVYDTRGWWKQCSLMALAKIDHGSSSDHSKSKAKERIRANASKVVDSIQGSYFAWPDKLFLSVYNIEQSMTVTHIPSSIQFRAMSDIREQIQHVCFSPDGSMMAVAENYSISTYMTRSATLLSRREFSTNCVVRSQFIDQGRKLLLQFQNSRHAVVDPVHITSSSFKNIKKIHLPISSEPQNHIIEVLKEPIGQYDFLYFVHGSELSRHDLKECIQAAAKENDQTCNDICPVGVNRGDHECSSNGNEYRLEVKSHELVSWSVKLVLLTYKSVACRVHNGFPSAGCQEKDPSSFVDCGENVFQELQRLAVYKEKSKGSSPKKEERVDAYFLPCQTRYVVECDQNVQVWALPSKESGRCKLLLMVPIPMSKATISTNKATVCPHHNSLSVVTDSGLKVYSFRQEDLREEDQVLACINSVKHIVDRYQHAEENHQQELLRYVLRYINHWTVGNNEAGQNVIEVLIKAPKSGSEAWDLRDKFLTDLLAMDSKDGTHWIPYNQYPQHPIKSNPISIVIDQARKTNPKCLPLAVTLINYCAKNAKEKKDIGYLSMVYQALPCVIEHQPDLVQEILNKSAFIPIQNSNRHPKQDLVINNALVRHPPSFNIFRRFISNPDTRSILSTRGSVFQLESMLPPYRFIGSKAEKERSNEGFRSEVYVAPFSLLWRHNLKKQVKLVNESMWWKSAFIALIWKIYPFSPKIVNSHDFEEDHLDNPVIAALLDYKWNTFVSRYWRFRFLFQFTYYLMVLVTAFLQIFDYDPHELRGVYIAIMTFSSMFLWLELQQLIRHPKRYFVSPYNYVDWCAYLVPMVACGLQLRELDETGSGPANNSVSVTWFGFAILAVYLHILFELRVVEGICKIVAIILNVTYRIKVFFVIFAGCVFAFSHSFLYLFWAGTGNATQDEIDQRSQDHPRNFGSSLTITYFMMGGRYDPMDDMFKNGDVGFLIMMVIYFFITVILMLNVLIALINTAFNRGESVWKVVWLESRLRFAESAENMSFIIPGFRRTHHWFPNEVYYTATPRDIKEFEERVASMASNNRRVLIGTSAMERAPSEISLLLQRPLGELQDPEETAKTTPVIVVPHSVSNRNSMQLRPGSPAPQVQTLQRMASSSSMRNVEVVDEMKNTQGVLQCKMLEIQEQLMRETEQRAALQEQLRKESLEREHIQDQLNALLQLLSAKFPDQSQP
ncbi:hypothetical protein BGZ59_007790 [Podila verticillata]|nr:hypothetical protein BGZ59_007790 [Podila verticillata]